MTWGLITVSMQIEHLRESRMSLTGGIGAKSEEFDTLRCWDVTRCSTSSNSASSVSLIISSGETYPKGNNAGG